MLTDRLSHRLQSLRSEHEAGQKMLDELDEKRRQLTQTMLRIEGAMQVLREMMEPPSPAPAPSPAPSPAPAPAPESTL